MSTKVELDPIDRNGSGTPVSGMSDIRAKTLTRAWIIIQLTMPVASNREKASGAFCATL